MSHPSFPLSHLSSSSSLGPYFILFLPYKASEFIVTISISARISEIIGGLDKLLGLRIKMTQGKKRDLRGTNALD